MLINPILRDLVEYVGEEVSPELPLQQLRLFLRVAEHEPEGITQSELVDKLNSTQASVSRNCRKLSQYPVQLPNGKFERAGYDLVECERDFYNPKQVLCKLSAKGRVLYAGMDRIVAGKK
jgi:DNA-binding MarR family transcriptional regulator